ncbi:MAG: hypothetical protein K0U93_25625 [Gammaproteobacteria bacterium]|nr:hypothetical protein [Gammaproteobacteria bacterium]
MTTAVDSGPVNRGAHARIAYLVLVALYPLGFAGLVATLVFGLSQINETGRVGAITEHASIDFPGAGAGVPGTFIAKGQIHEIPEGTTLYLATNSDNLYWPKQPLGDAGSSWSRKFTASPGPGYKYNIVILAVTPAGLKRIEAWFNDGERTGQYPPIEDFAEARPLAISKVVRGK